MQISQKNLLFYENKGLIIANINPLPLSCNEWAVGAAFAMPIHCNYFSRPSGNSLTIF